MLKTLKCSLSGGHDYNVYKTVDTKSFTKVKQQCNKCGKIKIEIMKKER